MIIERLALGVWYTFDSSKPQLLKRGIIDPYDKSVMPNEWVVLEPYVMWSAILQRIIVIPRWFRTDLASIPKSLRWLISVNERHRIASLPHDMLYCMAYYGSYTFDRHDADRVLLEFCKAAEVPSWKCKAMYSAVRLCGRSSYANNDRRMFINKIHRYYYIRRFPKLELDVKDGEYKEVKRIE